MKIAMVIGICTLAGAAMYGCSSPSTSTGGLGNTGTLTTPNGGESSGSASNSSASGSGGDDGTGASGSAAATSGGGGTSGEPAATSGSVSSSGAAASSGSPATSGSPDDSDAAAPAGITTSTTPPTDNQETDYTQTKTLTMGTFTVPANTEVFYCQTFANPWGKQVDIKTYDLTMDEGSHHMFAFYSSSNTDGSVAACAAGGLTYGAFTFVSQTPTSIITFPNTVGATLPSGMGFNLMVHYLNTTTAALTAHVSLTMYLAKPNVVTNHAGVIFMNNALMTVPATGQPVVSSATMKLNQDVEIMLSSSHMHKFGTNFTYTGTPPGGTAQTIYTGTQWDEPKPTVFATPMHFPTGTNYEWSCTDVNNTGKELTFGEYAQTNVMCIAVSIFYPVNTADLSNPVLGSPIGGL
jgi:hypothetical protein